MNTEDELVVLRADRENLHSRVRELLAENERLRNTVVAADREIKQSHADADRLRAEIKTLNRELDFLEEKSRHD
jgi:cell division protein FtsB